MEGIGQDIINEGQCHILRDTKRATVAKHINVQEVNPIDARPSSIAVEASHQQGLLVRAVGLLGHRREAMVMLDTSSISLASF